jgi:hypothetical protein
MRIYVTVPNHCQLAIYYIEDRFEIPSCCIINWALGDEGRNLIQLALDYFCVFQSSYPVSLILHNPLV